MSFYYSSTTHMAYRTTEKMAARKDARRRTLLECAIRLFGKHGYHATTVPMIVAEAASSTGSFYSYFRNKEDIFAAALDALGERIWTVIEAARSTVADPLEQIRAAVESLYLHLAANPREARILVVESSGLSPELEQRRRRVMARHADAVRLVIESAPERFAPFDPPIAAHCLVGAVFEAIYSWLETPPRKRPDVHDIARTVAEYNIRALAA